MLLHASMSSKTKMMSLNDSFIENSKPINDNDDDDNNNDDNNNNNDDDDNDDDNDDITITATNYNYY